MKEGNRRRLAAMTVALSPALVTLAARVAVADPPKASPPTSARPHPVARPAPRKAPPPPAETGAPAPTAGPTAEATALSGAPDAGISSDAAIVEAKTLDGGTHVFKFSELEIEGHLKSPQLVYFLRRVRAEFAAGDLGHRSFLREMSETRKEPSF
jgi:hypothetical protein